MLNGNPNISDTALKLFLKDPWKKKKKDTVWCGIQLIIVNKVNIAFYFTAIYFITSLFSKGKMPDNPKQFHKMKNN